MQRGFSLVELSIVLVILGLLTGGILAGQALIKASELRSVGRQVEQYRMAMNGFRDKYFYLPGDLPNAYSFWSTSCATSANLCNGNGDGFYPSYNQQEMWMGWKHMALAGLIPGEFTGAGVGAAASAAGVNIPVGPLSGSSFSLGLVDIGSGNKNFAMFGKLTNVADYMPHGNILSGEDTYNIDVKTDDGLPLFGKMVGLQGTPSNPNCATSSTNYAFTVKDPSCRVFFYLP